MDNPAQPLPVWREVPQALFLSWSPARQLAYCRLRDLDSAKFDPAYAEFYLRRLAADEGCASDNVELSGETNDIRHRIR